MQDQFTSGRKDTRRLPFRVLSQQRGYCPSTPGSHTTKSFPLFRRD
ncbi:unnamed protein product [Moneuplotes crassus]|uniref:Uncharacterized protein n=1 Tax=Euplotes crassus TaxID=5936 RepID=A0AAD1UPQ8_EUPCR|nr:unnamed protein product [Moneuplotes crassus]CAI2370855.1 unnamed protein product [Moneuplotes crassus]